MLHKALFKISYGNIMFDYVPLNEELDDEPLDLILL